MLVFRFLLGLAVLLKGRELFWLFVAALGFVAGAGLVSRVLPAAPEWVLLAAALVAGVAGAVFALALNRLAIGVAGFLAGGYVLVEAFRFLTLDATGYIWLIFLIGGLLGAVLTGLVFDWALIVLSALVGASLLLQTLPLESLPASLVLVTLVVIGVVVQARELG